VAQVRSAQICTAIKTTTMVRVGMTKATPSGRQFLVCACMFALAWESVAVLDIKPPSIPGLAPEKRGIVGRILRVTTPEPWEKGTSMGEDLGETRRLDDVRAETSGLDRVETSGLDNVTRIKSLMNANIDPCQDFHGYSCTGKSPSKGIFAELSKKLNRNTVSTLIGHLCGHTDYGATWVRSTLFPQYASLCDGPDAPVAKSRQEKTEIDHLNTAISGLLPSCLDDQAIETRSMPVAKDFIQRLMPNCPLTRGPGGACSFSKAEYSASLAKLSLLGASSSLFSMGVTFDDRNTSRALPSVDGQTGIASFLAVRSDTRSFLETSLQEYFDEAVKAGFPRQLNASKLLEFAAKHAAVFYKTSVDVPADDTKHHTVKEMSTFLPGIDWEALLQVMYPGMSILPELQTSRQPALVKLNELLPTLSPSDLADFFAMDALMGLDDAMPYRMRKTSHKIEEKITGREHSRASDCFEAVLNFGDWALSKTYVEKNFAAKNKQLVAQLAEDIRSAFKDSLNDLAWMDAASAQKAQEKADAMVLSIGYPDKLLSDANWLLNKYKLRNGTAFADLKPGTWVEALMLVQQLTQERDISMVIDGFQRSDWIGTQSPIKLSPYYNKAHNRIVFPASFLQPPVFNFDYPTAYIYGAVGYIMGHELTHGFDWTGSTRDAAGTAVSRWLSPTASAAFTEGSKCFMKQYTGQTVKTNKGTYAEFPADGTRTLSENIADNGGLALTYAAYHKRHTGAANSESAVAGLSNDQLMFLGASQFWCSEIKKAQLEVEVLQGVHSPDQLRAWLPFANFPYFAQHFKCPAGSKMNPKERCAIWTTKINAPTSPSGLRGAPLTSADPKSSSSRAGKSSVVTVPTLAVGVLLIWMQFQ